MRMHTGRIFFIGQVLLFASGLARAEDGKDLLGDPLPPEAVARMGTNREKENIPQGFARPDSLRGAAVSDDGKILATYGEPANPKESRLIQIWDAQSGKPLRSLEGHEWPIRAIAISPDGKTLVSSSFDVGEGAGITRVWDLATGNSRHVIPGGGDFVRFADGGSTFWLVDRDKLLVYGTDSGQEVRRFLGPNIPLDISQDGRRALGISYERDTLLRLYDVNTDRELLKLEGCDGAPRLARFSPDGRTIAALDHGATIKIWEVLTGRLVHELAGHKGRVFAIAFSPDGRFLASGGIDKTIRTWELATGKEVHRHAAHQGVVTVLSFAEQSPRLVSGSTDRTALLWNTTGSLVSQLERPKLDDDSLNNFWGDLSSAAPSQAYRAMGIFAAEEEQSFPFLQRRMEGLLIPSKNNRIDKLLKDLDDDDSIVRQRATRELRKLQASRPAAAPQGHERDQVGGGSGPAAVCSQRLGQRLAVFLGGHPPHAPPDPTRRRCEHARRPFDSAIARRRMPSGTDRQRVPPRVGEAAIGAAVIHRCFRKIVCHRLGPPQWTEPVALQAIRAAL